MNRILFTLLLLFSLVACRGPKAAKQTDTNGAMTAQMLKQAAYCGVEEQKLLVIEDGATWKTLWEQMNSIVMPTPAVPAVDFSKHMVVAYFLGTQNSGGHSVQIDKLEMVEEVLQVHIVHSKPGNNCATTSALTQPYCIVQVPKQAHSSSEAKLSAEATDC